MEGEDALKDDDIGTVHGNCLGFSSVCNKIVNRNINFLHLFQPLKSFSQELKIKSLRGIKVILIDRGGLVLPLIEDLVEAVHGEQGDPGHVQLGDDLVGHGGLPAGLGGGCCSRPLPVYPVPLKQKLPPRKLLGGEDYKDGEDYDGADDEEGGNCHLLCSSGPFPLLSSLRFPSC